MFIAALLYFIYTNNYIIIAKKWKQPKMAINR